MKIIQTFSSAYKFLVINKTWKNIYGIHNIKLIYRKVFVRFCLIFDINIMENIKITDQIVFALRKMYQLNSYEWTFIFGPQLNLVCHNIPPVIAPTYIEHPSLMSLNRKQTNNKHIHTFDPIEFTWLLVNFLHHTITPDSYMRYIHFRMLKNGMAYINFGRQGTHISLNTTQYEALQHNGNTWLFNVLLLFEVVGCDFSSF